MISIAAICAMLFFVSCGGDSKTPTPADETDTTADTEQQNDDDKTDSGSEVNDGGDTTPATDNDPENPDTATDTEPDDEPDTATDADNTDDPATDTDNADTEETPDPETCEFSDLEKSFLGTWAQKIILRSKSSSGLVAQNVPSVTTRYLVVEIKPSADCKLDFFKKDNQICRTDNRTGDNALNKGTVKFNEPDSKFNTIFFHWKPKDIAGQENDSYLEVAQNGEEITFKLNKDYELRGAKMDNPATEDMISNKQDSRIFDHDADGKDAFTIKFNGFIDGDMYYVQRLSHILTGKVVADGKIEGNVEWTDEQFAVGATNDQLAKAKTTVTDTNKSVFQLVKVDDSMDCATLLEKSDKGEIFDIVDPNTDVN